MSLEDRVKREFPNLFITLVSVLIGLVFGDLVTEARARMHLWPLSFDSLRTWSQLFGNGTSAVVVWIVYAHIGITRRQIPTLGDSFVAILPPVIILGATSFVGQQEIWPWFYMASVYLVSTIVSVHLTVRMALADAELANLKAVLRPAGVLSVPYIGVPFFAIAGWADQRHLLSPALEVLCAAVATPAALMAACLFYRDWRQAITGAPRPTDML